MIRAAVISAMLCLALGAPHGAAAQQDGSAAADTDTTDRVVIVDPGLSLGAPTLLLPRSLDERMALVVPPFVSRGWGPGQRPPFLGGPLRQNIDLLAPLRLQWEREEELRPLYTVLGAVQLGGVAYMAYEHIKKRGLFK